MLFVIAGLGVLCLGLTAYIIVMKRQLKNMTRELDRTSSANYDRLLLIQLFDRDINELANSINRSIDEHNRLKHEAEQTELALRQSVSDIAHDLRTPLSVIKGDLQLILREDDLSPRVRDYAEVCLEKTERLKAMSDQFFELAVLESDRDKAAIKRLDITKLLMSFIAEHEGVIRLAGIEPEIELPPKTVFIMADEALVSRMLGNLLGNVLKYSCGSFTLELTEEGRVTISNPVSGTLPDASRLFERTYRADQARSGSSAGLGLYIVKLLAEKQGAEVKAAAENGILSVTVAFRQK
ncbi:histidine kinase dimerization/phospho-acceptor domain-containing protein [Ruminococcus sp.]|uniref:sensor histidine kinase n=1 Tax=Ruminococcus sp. TaxID=41978 RepID=UPI0025ED2754|nr:histidine kinase dimerization/phospho-acceptor domain-containing protein [Ruminococcus sp.]MBQ8967786.1 sensor histidine kinase [Ruminococcus sp.]